MSDEKDLFKEKDEEIKKTGMKLLRQLLLSTDDPAVRLGVLENIMVGVLLATTNNMQQASEAADFLSAEAIRRINPFMFVELSKLRG